MFKKLIKNYTRAKELIKEDDKRIELERIAKLKSEAIKEEVARFRQSDIAYIKSLSEIDINAADINLATIFREFNRIELSIQLLAPTIYADVFYSVSYPTFDSIYVKDSECSPHEKSLTDIEKLFNENIGKENWPPKKYNLDYFDNAAHYTLRETLIKHIQYFKKAVYIIESYSI